MTFRCFASWSSAAARRAAQLAWIVLLTALGIVGACVVEHPQPAKLTVVSYSPEGARVADDVPIRIQFDRAVIAESEIGEPLDEVPATLEPSAELSGTWVDASTLVLTPRQLRPATRYKLRVSGELSEATSNYSFEFINLPLLARGVSGIDTSRLPPLPTLTIDFSQPVTPEHAQQQCHLMLNDGSTIALRPVEGSKASTNVAVTPETELKRGTHYRLVCEQMGEVLGKEAIQSDYSLGLDTYPELSVVRASPAEYDAPSDQVSIELEFSTPVQLDQVRRRVYLNPSVPEVAGGYLDETGKIYRAVVDLQSETSYQLGLSAGLADVYGQAMTQPYEYRFTTGHASPRIVLETGIFAVEPDPGNYAVWTRSMTQFSVRCAEVPRDKAVALLTSSLDYDPWYNASSDVEWTKFDMVPREHTRRIQSPKNNWHLESLDLREQCGTPSRKGKAPQHGLYLAELSSSELNPQMFPHNQRRVFANVTDLGVLMKAGTASGIVWVTQMSTGKPAAGASVELYSPQGKRVFVGTTDGSGILRTPGSNELLVQPGTDQTDGLDGENEFEWDGYRSQRMIAIVSKGKDVALVDGNWANGIQTWNFGVPEERGAGKVSIRGFIQSDRGIYRPGETVHFKGIVREIALGRAPAPPKARTAAVRIADSRGATLFEGDAEMSRFGGFHFDHVLSDDAKLGDYYVTAKVGGQVFRERFFVEEFRTLTYEVNIKAENPRQRLGEAVRAHVQADYLFGAPLANAKTKWTVRRREHNVHFERYAQYTFSDDVGSGRWWGGWYGGYYDSSTHLTDGEGLTDQSGGIDIEVQDVERGHSAPQDFIFDVQVTDSSDQTVSKQKVITAHKSDFYLGLHTQEWLQAVDMPFSVNAVAVDPTGKRVETDATLAFVRMEYDCKKNEGYRRYSSCEERPVTMLTRKFRIPKAGTATERIVPRQPGDYIVRIETKDARGNVVKAAQSTYVIGRGEAFWSGDESARMALVASRDQYSPGDTAKLLPRTNMSDAHALVTLERNGVIDARVERVVSASDGLSVKLGEQHAPNVWASVAMVTGRSGAGDENRPKFKLGLVELKVKAESQRLQVKITPEKKEYQPGETVRGKVRVTSKGKPVSAELSLSAADEGVLQLIAYQTPDPMDTFYRSWGLGTDASTNWNRLARLNDPRALDPDEGGDSGGAGNNNIRSNFLSSAYWAPALVTDAKGEAAFSFTAPDNLTAFRLMVAAADTGARFGASDERITIKKPLLLEPVLPRFLTENDRAEIGVLVHNTTKGAMNVRVDASAVGVALEANQRTLALKAGEVGRARFAITAKSDDEATFTFAAKGGDHSDAVRVALPIHLARSMQSRQIHSGAFDEAGGKRSLPLTWTKGHVAAESRVIVRADRSGLGELVPGLRYLVQYPYGCLEQTLSRFIPLAKFQDLTSALGNATLADAGKPGSEPLTIDETRAQAFLKAGAAKIVRHQHADGHFSLWPSGPTYPHLTAYALFGLLEGGRAGVEVDEHAIRRGAKALRKWANQRVGQGVSQGELGSVAMAAFVLADNGTPDVGLNSKLFELRRGLPNYGAAFLIRALHRTRQVASLETMKRELLNKVQQQAGGAMLRESGDLREYMSSDVRSTAMLLTALLETEPNHRTTHALAEGLRAARLSSGAWRTTQDNIYALTALSVYARRLSAGKTKLDVQLGSGPATPQTLDGLQLFNLEHSAHDLGSNQLQLQSSGRLRYSVNLLESIPIDVSRAVDSGFQLKREYLDPKTLAPINQAKASDMVLVRLSWTTPTTRRYVALESPLPAGLEPLNTKLATSQTTTKTQGSWYWTHTELRDDRVLAFADYLPSGARSFEYLARATIPGTFQALPAHIEEMYDPDVLGRTVADRFMVTP